jgi:hypothetical protein
MIPKVVSPLKQIMDELHNYYMALYSDHFLVMYDTQKDIIIGDALRR